MTIRLEISDYMSGDVENVSKWVPPDNNVYLQLTIEIQEVGDVGGHFFQLVVATKDGVSLYHRGEAKAAFDELKKNSKGYAKNALLIFYSYSWQDVQKKLERIVKGCERETWQESIDELRKNFFWEYENIQYHDQELINRVGVIDFDRLFSSFTSAMVMAPGSHCASACLKIFETNNGFIKNNMIDIDPILRAMRLNEETVIDENFWNKYIQACGVSINLLDQILPQ